MRRPETGTTRFVSKEDASLADRSRAIQARALVSTDRLAEALALFEGISPETLDEPGALAWLEAIRGVQGRNDAIGAAQMLGPRVQRWSEVLARIALWTEQERRTRKARFELAEALNAAGRTTSARDTYAALAAREQPHQAAAAAPDRLDPRLKADTT